HRQIVAVGRALIRVPCSRRCVSSRFLYFVELCRPQVAENDVDALHPCLLFRTSPCALRSALAIRRAFARGEHENGARAPWQLRRLVKDRLYCGCYVEFQRLAGRVPVSLAQLDGNEA